MTEAYFNRLAAEGYNRIPVTLETFADLDTPLSIYLKLANSGLLMRCDRTTCMMSPSVM